MTNANEITYYKRTTPGDGTTIASRDHWETKAVIPRPGETRTQAFERLVAAGILVRLKD